MNQTVNLHLPQFEATDRIHHDDFNEAFQTLDTLPRIVTGTYTGDGQSEHFIDLGFTPKAVLVFRCDGLNYFQSTHLYSYGGLALQEHPCVPDSNSSTVKYITVEEGGFKVYAVHDANCYARTNESGSCYHYIAFV